jgi:Family of unknown function (DUF5947)
MVGRATETEPLTALKRFARVAPVRELCELCGLALDAVHPHLLERKARTVVCACGACALLFSNREDGKYFRIPTSVRSTGDLSLDALHWEELGLPINLAFFFRDAEGKLRAMYPSPAGAIESSLPFDDNSGSFTGGAAMQPEVEALLVSRIADEEATLILPIDECFRLTGLIRTQWRGLSGGTEVWKAIRAFLAEMRTRAEARTRHA